LTPPAAGATLRPMIVEYIRYEVSDPDAFVQAYEQARAALDSSPYCRG
jgi:hypothetical protein